MTLLFLIILIKKNNIIFPKKKVFHANLIETPRYGENPHQRKCNLFKEQFNQNKSNSWKTTKL